MNAAPAQESPLNLNPRKDWKTAFRAMGKLLSDPNDTTQVFLIMRALNAGTAQKNYARLLTTAQGGRLAYERLELIAPSSPRPATPPMAWPRSATKFTAPPRASNTPMPGSAAASAICTTSGTC